MGRYQSLNGLNGAMTHLKQEAQKVASRNVLQLAAQSRSLDRGVLNCW